MRKLLDIDSPIMRFLAWLADLVILNTLFILTSLPLITLGASLCALQTSLQNLLRGKNQAVVKNYFRLFRQNFKLATGFWLIFLGLAAVIYSDFRLLGRLPLPLEFLLGVATILFGLILFMLGNSYFAYIGRYENSFKISLQNCLRLSLQNLYQSLFLLVFNGFVIYFTLSSPAALLTMIYLLTFGGFALIQLINGVMLKQIFDKIEKKNSVSADRKLESHKR